MAVRLAALALAALTALTAAAPSAAQTAADGAGLRAATFAETGYALHAVGRLDIRGRGFCTAALVAPALVLTAAHCLHAEGRPDPYPLDDLLFRAGYDRGETNAERGVRRVVLHPDYVPGRPDKGRNIAADLALLELDREIDPYVVPPLAAAGRLGPGDRVRIISYAEARERSPSYEDSCHVIDRDARILALDCDVTFGSSGAPVFAGGPDGLRIASVVSSGTVLDGRRVALAATVEAGLDPLMAAFARAPRLSAQRKVLRAGERGGGTIRFVRP